MVTASAAFKVLDQASDPIKKITEAGKIMDKSMESAGKALDKIDSPQVTQSLKTTEKNVKSLGNQSTKAGAQIEQFTDKTGRNFTKMAATGTAKIDALTRALKHFEHERATATLDVNIAKAEAKIRLIKHELRTFTTMQAQKELESLGLVASSTTAKLSGGGIGGGGGGPPGAGGLAGGFASAGSGAALMGAAILAALPALVVLTGAVSALVGSLGLAVGGAGVIGIGVMGAFVVGIGAIVASVKPAITELKAVKDAQTKYNDAITQYGRKSAQAVAAEKQLSAIRRKSPGAADVLRNAGVVSGRWKKATAPARGDVFGIINAGLETVMSNLPLFATITNKVMDSARSAVEDFLKPFRGPEWHSIFKTLGDTFAAIEGPGMRAFGNVLMWLGRVAQAASPVVVSMFDKLEAWTSSLADKVANRERTTATVERLVHALGDWVRFGGSAVRLMAAFFGAGANQGTSMVEGITKQFDQWTKWLHEHPQEMHDFFTRTIDSAGKLVNALGNIAKALAQIGDAMIPLLNMMSGLVNLTGGNLAPLALVGGARLALGKGFGLGKLMGGGAAAAGIGGAGAGVAGAAGAVGVRGAIGTMRDTYGVARAYGGSGFVGAMGGASRAGAAGSALLAGGKLAARGAAKFALPLTAGLAAWDFLSYKGNVGQRLQNAASGATFGLIHAPVSSANQHSRGVDAAQQFISRQPGIGTIQDRITTLQHSLAATTPGHLIGGGRMGPTMVKTGFTITGGERTRVQAQLDALKPILHAQVQLKAGRQGLTALDDLTKAFETRWHAAGSRAARKGLLHDIEAQMKDLGPKGKRALLAGVADWTATLEGGNKRQRLAAQSAKNQIVSIYRSMGEAVAVVQGKIVALNSSNWDKISKDVSTASNRAAFEATGAFTEIMNAASRALRLLGYSGGESKEIVAGLTQGGRAGRYAQNAVNMGSTTLHSNAKKGAAIGDGHGWGDGAGADEFGKHASQAAKTSTQVSKASGFSGGLMGAKAGLGVYAQDAAGYGLHVSSGLRKGAITKSGNVSYHSSGDAIDVSGPPEAMLSFAKHAANSYGSRLEELIHTPMGFGIKNGHRIKSFGKAVDADHFDHVHLADTKPPGGDVLLGGGAGGGGVLGGSVAHAKIAAPRSKAGGVLGVASDRMYATIAAATQKKLNAVLDASGGVGGGGGGPTGGTMTFNQVARLAESVGLPGIAFAQIAKGESGFQPGAVGHDPGGTQGLGLWQITTGYNDDIIKRFGGRQAMFNAHTNALAAKAIYDRAGIGAWYGTRYLTDPTAHFQGDGIGRQGTTSLDWGGWFGRGGEFTAHKPTLIGVGDGGSERVTIKPSGMASSTGRRPVEIHIDKLVNYEEGDISDILERELNKVADNLDKGVDGEDELT